MLLTGPSDFYRMTVIVMAKIFNKLKPRIINIRSYQDFSNKAYREFLLYDVSKKNFINNDDGLQRFYHIYITLLCLIVGVGWGVGGSVAKLQIFEKEPLTFI